jgi:hypothetical protein
MWYEQQTPEEKRLSREFNTALRKDNPVELSKLIGTTDEEKLQNITRPLRLLPPFSCPVGEPLISPYWY